MTDHTDLIEELRKPLHVTLKKGAPELDDYDEQRAKAADALACHASALVAPLAAWAAVVIVSALAAWDANR